jgi:hypothetical protein
MRAHPGRSQLAGEARIRTAIAQRDNLIEQRRRPQVRVVGEPAAEALRLLLGASVGSKSLPLKTRRRMAADELAMLPSTFRRLCENNLIEDFVVELHRPSRGSDGNRAPMT